MRITSLSDAADGIEHRRVEVAGQAVEAFLHGPLVVPAQTNVERQPGRNAPIILGVKTHESLRIKCARIHGNVTARGQAQEERGESGSLAGATANSSLRARPHTAEIKLAPTHAKARVRLLQNPVLSTVVKCVVAVYVSERGRPGVIGVVLVSARLTRAEVLRTVRCSTCEARDVGEGRLRQLRNKAGRKTELCRVEARPLVPIGLFIAVHIEMHVEHLVAAEGPHMIQAKVFGNPLLESSGCRILEEIVEELLQVAPAYDREAVVRIVPSMVHADR